MGNLVAASTNGPYWQPAQAARGFGAGLGLGDTPLVLPTTPMAGATGWLAVTVTNPPNANIQWNSSQTPQVEVWVRDSTGALKQFTGGGSAAGTGSITWLTAGSAGTVFYLLPIDANGVLYAPVDQVTVAGQAGIYPSPNTPSSTIAQIQAANQGIQIYGMNLPSNITLPPASSDPFSFLSTLPGGEGVWLGGAALLLLLVVMKK